MKSGVRKALLALLLSAAALTLRAAPSPQERAKQELQPDGELYLMFSPETLRRHIADVYLALERGIAESSMPDRDKAQSALTLLRMINRLSGIPEIAVLGASSVRDADLGFSNRAVIAAEPGGSGWLWRIHGSVAPRLARIGELPADTALALDFSVNFAPVIEDLKKAGFEDLLARRSQWLLFKTPAEILETVSGDWQIAVAIPDDRKWDNNNPFMDEIRKCDVFISAPDNRGELAKLLDMFVTLTPSKRRLGNVLYISDGGRDAMVFVKLDRRLMFFSSVRSFDKFCDGSANVGANGRFVPGAPKSKDAAGRKTLSGEPGFAAAVKRLPADSHGAYFTSDARISGMLKIGGRNGFRLSLPQTANRSIGIWRIDDGMIVNRELATEGFSTQVFDTMVGTPLVFVTEYLIGKSEKPAPPAKKSGRKVRPGRKPQTPAARIAEKTANTGNAECRARLEKVRSAIADHAKSHNGELPKTLPLELTCGKHKYVYFGPFSVPPSGKIPLVVDPVNGNAHPGTINVLFVDGSIESFEFDAKSLKRLCSYLHTIHNYKEPEFIRLIRRASQLDSEKGK